VIAALRPAPALKGTDRVAVSHLRFLLSHPSTIAALHHAANSTATQEPAEPEPDRTCGWVYFAVDLIDEVEPDEVAVFCPECWSREFSDAS
jgi:hypothetical protein